MRSQPKEKAMAQARHLMLSASYDPDTLKMLGKVFEEAWITIAGNFGKDAQSIENARLKLAAAMLGLAAEGIRDPEQLKASSLRLVQLDYNSQS
jgi:hypothetical protein